MKILKNEKNARSVYPAFLLTVASLLILAGLALSNVLAAEGWPKNHENNSFFLRSIIYAEHMQQGDFFPIWSSVDNYGAGSPQPAMYHKLFYLFTGLIILISGSTKFSIVMTLWISLFMGAFGVYILSRELGCSRLLAWAGATMLIFSNYTITNWLVRGAMAEFLAAMLVPYVLVFFTRWLNAENDGYEALFLGAATGVLFIAHSVLAYYVVIM